MLKNIKIKNINNTSDKLCACGSWLKHWEKYSNQSLLSCCSEIRCIQKPEDGALVQKDSPTDSNWYIVPLCKTHNAKTGGSLDVVEGIKLVPADVKETCGKILDR